jgi:hypothetical protein
MEFCSLTISNSYPPLSTVVRTYVDIITALALMSTRDHNFRARKDAVLPFFTPITGVDGREMHEIVVPKNTNVIISILNCNCDPALWGPDSYEWKPERWLSPLPDTLIQAPVPGIYSSLWVYDYAFSWPACRLTTELARMSFLRWKGVHISVSFKSPLRKSLSVINSGFKFSQLEMSAWLCYSTFPLLMNITTHRGRVVSPPVEISFRTIW